MPDNKAYLTEIFSSIQGEGPWLGYRQIFLRFRGCDLRCQWCDTPDSLSIPSQSQASIELIPGKRDFKVYNNPFSLSFVADALQALDKQLPHHSLSLTGGEPLMQHKFIKQLLIKLKTELNFKPSIYLETSGHKAHEFNELKDLVDCVSFDLKLPSSTAEKPLWEQHKQFIKLSKHKQGYVKIILTAESTDSDLLKACNLLKKESESLEMVLQSASPVPHCASFSPPSPEQMLQWQALAIGELGRGRVRVIPQTHKLMGQL